MTQLKFSKLKLKVDTTVKTHKILSSDDKEFTLEVKQYLPIKEKADLVTMAVETSVVHGIIRKDFLEANLGLGVIYNYTNLEFTDKMLENALNTYDIVESTGLIDLTYSLMDEKEKDELFDYVNDYAEQMEKAYAASVTGYSAQEAAIQRVTDQIIGKDIDEITKEFNLDEDGVTPSE